MAIKVCYTFKKFTEENSSIYGIMIRWLLLTVGLGSIQIHRGEKV